MIRFYSFIFILLVLSACDTESSVTPPEPEVPADAPITVEDLLEGDLEVTKNPYDLAPLTAEAVFSTTVPVRVSLTVPGEEPVTQTFGAATEHRIPILGLYPDTDNQVTLRLESDEAAVQTTLTIETPPLPVGFPTVDITAANREAMEPGWTLSGFRFNDDPVRPVPFMFDANGDIRWYIDLSFLEGRTALERLANGNFVFGLDGTIYEYNMLGAEINRWQIPGYLYHHDIVEKSDGNLVIAAAKEGLDTVDDFVIELARDSGEIVRVWDFRQVLDVSRQTYEQEVEDWLHMNAVWYDESDDTLIVSGRNQGVVKVTAENELVWILAPHKGWGRAGPAGNGFDTSEYLLTAVDANGNPYAEPVQQGDESAADFGWTWGQHAPMVLPNGNLFVFDNGRKRNFSEEGPTFSRGVEYEIDEEAMTVKQVWQYGEARGDAFYSPIISDVDYLPQTDNRLIMPGIINSFGEPPAYALVTEVTYPNEEVVFEADIKFANLFDGASRFKDSVYRSERLPLYPPSAE